MKRKRKLARRQSGDKTWSNKRTRKEDARKFLADWSDEENSIDSHDTTAETEEETVENIARLVQHDSDMPLGQTKWPPPPPWRPRVSLFFLFCFCFGTIRCLFVWYYEKMQSFCAHTQVLRDKRKQVFHDLKFQDDWSNNNIAVAWARTLFSYSDRFWQ